MSILLRGLLCLPNPGAPWWVEQLFATYKRREQVLSGLGAAWRRRSLSERGAVEGIVQSARELGSGEVAELALALGRTLGKDVQLENQVVPDLVGGVRVFVDNRMLDCSVQGRLASLRQRMLSAPLAAAAG